MFEQQISKAREFASRIEECAGKGLSQIPNSVPIYDGEYQTWYRSVERIIATAFGEPSHEMRLWRGQEGERDRMFGESLRETGHVFAAYLWFYRNSSVLMEEFDAKLSLEAFRMPGAPGPDGNMTVIINGDSARVYYESNDHSNNIVGRDVSAVFGDLKAKISGIDNDSDASELLRRVEAMEAEVGRPTFVVRYSEFIAAAANHMTLLAPFLPALTEFLR